MHITKAPVTRLLFILVIIIYVIINGVVTPTQTSFNRVFIAAI